MTPTPVQPVRNAGFDAATYKPRKVDDWAIYDRGWDEPEESRYLLTHADGAAQLVLANSEKVLWEMFDGEKTVNDVCQEYLGRHRTLVMTRLYSLIQRLWEQDFLRDDPRMARSDTAYRGGWLSSLRLTSWARIPLPGSGAFGKLLGKLLRPLPLAAGWFCALVILVILGGLLAFSGLEGMDRYPLLRIARQYELETLGLIPPSYILGAFLLLLLHIVGSFLHAFSRAAAQSVFTDRLLKVAKPGRVQLVFNYLIPCFQHEARWVNALPSWQRLLVGTAGITGELLLATLLTLLLSLDLFAGLSREIVYKLVYVLYLRSFLHLSPFAGSDFPWLMQTLSDIRHFRRKALGYLRYSLVPTLRGDLRVEVEHKFYLAYNLVSAFWMSLAAAIAVRLLTANQYMLHNLLYVWEHGEELAVRSGLGLDMAILAAERHFVVLIVGLVVFFVFASLLGSVCWGLYVFWQWLRGMPVWRQTTVLIGAGLVAMLAFLMSIYILAFIRVITPDLAQHAMHWGQLTLGLVGGLILFALVRDDGASRLTLRTSCFALAMITGVVALVLEHHATSLQPARIAHFFVLVFLAMAYLIGAISHLHPLAFRKTQLLLPELTILMGTIVMAVGSARGLNADPELLMVIDNNRFVGMALIFIGNGVILRVLRDLSMPLESFAIDMGSDTEDRALKRILAGIMERQARLLASKFGEHGLERIERHMNRGNDEEFGFSSLYIPEQSTPEEIGRLYRDKLQAEKRLIGRYYGHRFAREMMDRVFQTLHWECKLLLERELLTGTPWEGNYRREDELDAEARTRLINSISIFNELAPNERHLLVRHTILEHYEAGERIIRQGDLGDRCYILVDGEVQVEERDPVGETCVLAFLRDGDFFGETALLQNTPRVASVRATTPCRLLALQRSDFDTFGQQYPEMVHRIRDRLHNLLALLRIPLFGDLPSTLLRSILPRVRTERYDTNQDIITQGDIGKTFYLIKEGQVAVLAAPGGEEEEICQLGARDYFGEIALLKDIPRTATVRALERTEVMVVEKDDFFQLLRGSRLFAHSLQVVGENRLASS